MTAQHHCPTCGRAFKDILEYLRGRDVAPQELLPPFPADGIFKRAYPVADTGLYLCVSDAETADADARLAEVEVLCDGPNMGSAGGPTLQILRV